MSKLTNEQIVALFIRTCERATIDNIVDLPYTIYENKYSNLTIYRTDTSIYLNSYNSVLIKYDVKNGKYIVLKKVANVSITSTKHAHLFMEQAPSYKVLFSNPSTIIILKNGTISQKLKRARSENTINSILKELKELYKYLEYLDNVSPKNKPENSEELQQEIARLFFSKGKDLC